MDKIWGNGFFSNLFLEALDLRAYVSATSESGREIRAAFKSQHHKSRTRGTSLARNNEVDVLWSSLGEELSSSRDPEITTPASPNRVRHILGDPKISNSPLFSRVNSPIRVRRFRMRVRIPSFLRNGSLRPENLVDRIIERGKTNKVTFQPVLESSGNAY